MTGSRAVQTLNDANDLHYKLNKGKQFTRAKKKVKATEGSRGVEMNEEVMKAVRRCHLSPEPQRRL